MKVDHPCSSGVVPVTEFFCGDPRLGPSALPSCLPLSSSFAPYDRLGGHQCPHAFLDTWCNQDTKSYIYPPSHGFQLSLHGEPILGQQTLLPGMIVDRFGSENGCFLSPASTPFTQRSLPPKSLNMDPDDLRFPCSYHVYKVEKPFSVLSGPIAAWFGQPGQGTQYQTDVCVRSLVEGGFLSRVKLRRRNMSVAAG